MSIAIRFWGDAIGESIPPILEERAIPRIKAFDMFESDGRLRSMGLPKVSVSNTVQIMNIPE